MNWIKKTFNTNKVIIGLIHLRAFPGTANYKKECSVEEIINQAKKDYKSLVDGGIDAVVFCDEYDKPYFKQAMPHNIAIMTRVVTSVIAGEKKIPFGIDMQWDPKASIAIAKATGASFIRGIVVGTYCGDYGMYSVDVEDLMNYKHRIGADDIKIFTNLCPEFSYSLDNRPLKLRAQTAFKSSLVDGVLISGTMAGNGVAVESLTEVKKAVKGNCIMANTGVNFDTIKDILKVVDGCYGATCIKEDGISENSIDVNRVKKLVKIAKGE